MELKICNISDTHNCHWDIMDKMEEADVLFHAGDFTTHGTPGEVEDFFEFFLRVEWRYDKIIFIAGNHDFFVTDRPDRFRTMVDFIGDKFVYLEDKVYNYNGFKIYGTPWTTFNNWTFMMDRNSPELAQKRSNIPMDTDILLSHSPPYGMLDRGNTTYLSLGCELLRQRIDEMNPKPKLVTFGHVHAGYGMDYKMHENMMLVNSSIISPMEDPKTVKDPIVVHIEI